MFPHRAADPSADVRPVNKEEPRFGVGLLDVQRIEADELVYRNTWRTRDEADNALFAYIDGWYNRERIQKKLDWLSPDEYDTAWHAKNFDESKPDMIKPEPTPTR